MLYTIDSDGIEDLDHSYALKAKIHQTKVYVEDPTFLTPESDAVILYTKGVGPCIAFLASGRYYTDADDDKGHYFAAVYHHTGEEQSKITEDLLLKLGQDNLYQFFDGIVLEVGEEEDIRFVLHQFCLIGGQKKEEHFCGTEKEVRALAIALQQNNPFSTILPENMRIHESFKPEYHFFPSHGEAFVNIYVQREGDASMKISYQLIDNNPLPLAADGNYESPVPSPLSPVNKFFSSPQSVDNSEGKRKAPLTPPENAPPEKRIMLFKS